MTRVAAMKRRPRGRRTAKTTASPATQGGSPVPRNVQSPSATTKNVTPGHRSTISGSSLTNAMMVYPITIVTARTKYMYIPQTPPRGGKCPRRAPDANDNTAIRIPVAARRLLRGPPVKPELFGCRSTPCELMSPGYPYEADPPAGRCLLERSEEARKRFGADIQVDARCTPCKTQLAPPTASHACDGASSQTDQRARWQSDRGGTIHELAPAPIIPVLGADQGPE